MPIVTHYIRRNSTNIFGLEEEPALRVAVGESNQASAVEKTVELGLRRCC
jgi:hypothetical protein